MHFCIVIGTEPYDNLGTPSTLDLTRSSPFTRLDFHQDCAKLVLFVGSLFAILVLDN